MYGIPLTGTSADHAALLALCERRPELVRAPWVRHADALSSPAMTDEDVAWLARRGFPLVPVDDRGETFPSLVQAVPPRAVSSPPPGVAWFTTPLRHSAWLLGALTTFERTETRLSQVAGPETELLLARVPDPPVYVLLRAADSEALTAYAPAGTALWMEWGYEHPLAPWLDVLLARDRRVGMYDRHGRLLEFPVEVHERGLHEAMNVHVPPVRDVFTPVPGELTFEVRLRLVPTDHTDPELFILAPDDLLALESLVEGSAPEEMARVGLSRLGDRAGHARYIVRELPRPGVTRIGPRIAALLGQHGFTRATGWDTLYLPVGRRLAPFLRPDDLRRVLSLDDAAAVVVDEDADGLSLTRVLDLQDAPLSQLVRYVALDRRVELDRLYESALWSFPRVEGPRPPAVAPPVRVPVPARVAATRRPATPQRAAPPSTTADEPSAARAELQNRAAGLEERLLGEEALSAATWRALGQIQERLRDPTGAMFSFSTALFLGDPSAGADLSRVAPAGRPLLDVMTSELVSADDYLRAAADVIEGIDHEEFSAYAVKLFLRPDLPIPRKLQWAVLRHLAHRSDDNIGLVRAKEAVLGAINTRGLSESLDLPRFIRVRLASTGNDRPTDEFSWVHRARGEQIAYLERLLLLTQSRPSTLVFRAIVLDGLARLGAPNANWTAEVRARAETDSGMVSGLVSLYLERQAFSAASTDAGVWQNEVRRVLATIESDGQRRSLLSFLRRSPWLRDELPADTRRFGSAVRDLVADAERGKDLVECAERLLAVHLLDEETALGAERLLEVALATGREASVRAVAAVVLHGHALTIPSWRMRITAAVLRAAATADDTALVEASLEAAVGILSGPRTPLVRELLYAVRPALAALRRVGASEAASRFLWAFVGVTERPGGEVGPICAALSTGFFQLGDESTALQLRDRALERVWAERIGYVDRYEAAAATVEAFHRLPLDERGHLCCEFAERIATFRDTFTTGPYFAAHEVLLFERLVDCLVDEGTSRTSRVQSWLEQEEVRIRRSIAQDCRRSEHGST